MVRHLTGRINLQEITHVIVSYMCRIRPCAGVTYFAGVINLQESSICMKHQLAGEINMRGSSLCRNQQYTGSINLHESSICRAQQSALIIDMQEASMCRKHQSAVIISLHGTSICMEHQSAAIIIVQEPQYVGVAFCGNHQFAGRISTREQHCAVAFNLQ